MTRPLLLATRKGTFIVEKTNGTWTPRLAGHAGGGVNYVAKDPHTGRLWALLGYGHWGAKLSISDDQGQTWRDNASQVKYPAGARFIAQDMYEDAESEYGHGFRISTKEATLQKLWSIAFGPGGRIWIGTIPGGLFESRDGGDSFSLNLALWNHESRGGDLSVGDPKAETKWFGTPASEGGNFAPGIHSISVDPRDGERVLIGVSTAGVIETSDGGKSWRSRNKGMLMDHSPEPEAEWGHDTHAIDRCEGDPDHIWQQNHVGVYYSADGAASWKKVSVPEAGVHFGFPVAADARNGRRAWVLPAHSDQQRMALGGGLFVARTDDGGQSWRQLREGLPQNNAHDVVYRHALAADGETILRQRGRRGALELPGQQLPADPLGADGVGGGPPASDVEARARTQARAGWSGRRWERGAAPASLLALISRSNPRPKGRAPAGAAPGGPRPRSARNGPSNAGRARWRGIPRLERRPPMRMLALILALVGCPDYGTEELTLALDAVADLEARLVAVEAEAALLRGEIDGSADGIAGSRLDALPDLAALRGSPQTGFRSERHDAPRGRGDGVHKMLWPYRAYGPTSWGPGDEAPGDAA
jgi:photosystem II stability/assembly factor-like uncharacterized protein